MNRLKDATSPYLQQHADNPVHWYEWGKAAFEEAGRSNKPILLSIGYSTCHWCHVMAHESFADPEIAQLMNDKYVSIKVDREERPDIDAVYMSAVQLLHGHGGWPMTIWCLPDARPYFAATYLPPKDGMRGARMGFPTMLKHLHELYMHDRVRVNEAADDLSKGIKDSLAAQLPGKPVNGSVLDAAIRYYQSRFDPVHGGIAGAPKFPSSLPVRLMHVLGQREMAEKTLDGMAHGGIYDHLAGGFHRYSTDEAWLVPHFEKMLYDNALLVRAYAEGYLLNGRHEDVIRETCDYVLREMTAPTGLFYSATDADTEGEEGLMFTWTHDELMAITEPGFALAYGATPQGNFDGRNVLGLVKPLERAHWADARRKLFSERQRRPQPHRDDKHLASWIGLMIQGLVHAGDALDEQRYIDAATKAGEAVFATLWRDGHLQRGMVEGFLDDYANMVGACLALFSSTAQAQWLERAQQLAAVLDAEFWDPKDGGYFVSSARHETLIAREKPQYDGAEPSGNATMAEHLLELYDWTQKEAYRERLEALFHAFGGVLERAPQAMPHMLIALAKWQSPTHELAIIGEAPALKRVSRGTYWKRVVRIEVPAGVTLPVPWLKDKTTPGMAYFCTQQTCLRPTADATELRAQVEQR